MAQHDENIQSMLDELEGAIGLSGWEEDFLDSCRDWGRRGVRLTAKMEDRLEAIYSKHS